MDPAIDMDRPADHQQQQQQLCLPMVADELVGTGGGAVSGRVEMRKRRFTEEQTRSLESMFHAHHAKQLEPREKAERAREIGLQPRQVAIWFQNKRARWRTKQLERDHADLRGKYDALHAVLESLRQEKLALTAQLHELSERLRERDQDRGGSVGASSSGDERKLLGCANMEPPESCVLGGACATPEDMSVESEWGDHSHLDYDEGFLVEPLCATTPELWEPWPPA